MTKIVLLLWTLSPTGEILETKFEGFRDIGACKAAGVSLTEPHPDDGWSPVQVVRCVEVPPPVPAPPPPGLVVAVVLYVAFVVWPQLAAMM